MKMILFILMMIALNGCYVNHAAVRPFVITNKVVVYTERYTAEYRFVDATGQVFMFYDDSRLHNVGDTIK